MIRSNITTAFSGGAISTQAEAKRLLEKHAIAPSAARLCYMARDSSAGRPPFEDLVASQRHDITASDPMNKTSTILINTIGLES
jgi:hypothetical protein